ncbi:unnamed protein product [Staurois parvus]|uniref:Uncharacterized protein n=1 Tax=Staurois parvus TaxID=386267 RepID=A0ABN9DMC1_9NEOB|nr:unnamed protein product [Staurois parvus]
MYTVITYSLSPLRWWRGCFLSAEDSGPLLHLSPQRRCQRSRKLELGNRNSASQCGLERSRSTICARC